MNYRIIISFSLCLFAGYAFSQQVNITRELEAFMVKHGEREVEIRRNQDTDALIDPDFARTSRPCPPFCAQPMLVSPAVATIGEAELVAFMQTRLKEGAGVLVDARTADWYQRGTIPGSVNIPYTHLNPNQGADELTLEDSLLLLGVTLEDETWDFSGAREVVLWCNGPWCGQSPTAIRGLLSIGYPAEKLYYYRGGMQLWRIFGLPVIYPDGRLRED